MLAFLAQATLDTTPLAGQEVEWVLSALRWAVEQYQQGNYAAVVGVVVMLLVTGGRAAFPNAVSAERAPLVSAGLGVALSMGTNLAALAVGARPMDWLTAAGTGLFAGAAASGFWSLAGKRAAEVLKSKFTKKE